LSFRNNSPKGHIVSGVTDENDQDVINIGRFLQSCHEDGPSLLDNETPIEISSSTRTTCIGKTIDFSVDDSTFESNVDLGTILTSFGDTRTLRSREETQRHLKHGLIGWDIYTGVSNPPLSPATYENGCYYSSNYELNINLNLTNKVPIGIRLFWAGSAQITNIEITNNSDEIVLEATGTFDSAEIIPLTINDDTGEINNINITFDTLIVQVFKFELYGNRHSSQQIDYDIGYSAGEIQGQIDGYNDDASDDSTTGSVDYVSGYEAGYAIGYTQGGNDLTSYNNGYSAGDAQGYIHGLADDAYDDSTVETNTYYISGYETGYAVGYARGESEASSQGMTIEIQQMMI